MNPIRRAWDFYDRAAIAATVRFNEWFCSAGGVRQTFYATAIVSGVEIGRPSLDPHAFLLMAVLTVYSGVTQPALAYSGARSAAKLEALEQRVEAMEQLILADIRAICQHLNIPTASPDGPQVVTPGCEKPSTMLL